MGNHEASMSMEKQQVCSLALACLRSAKTSTEL